MTIPIQKVSNFMKPIIIYIGFLIIFLCSLSSISAAQEIHPKDTNPPKAPSKDSSDGSLQVNKFPLKDPTISLPISEKFEERGRSPYFFVQSISQKSAPGHEKNSRFAKDRELYFSGFIYPKLASHTERLQQESSISGTTVPVYQKFELDVPLKVRTGMHYYAFGLSLKFETDGNLDLELVPSIEPLNVAGVASQRPRERLLQLEGPNCKSVSKYYSMHRKSLRETGIKSWAAYNTDVEQVLQSGQAAFFETCESQALAASNLGKSLVGKKARLRPRAVAHRVKEIVILVPVNKIPENLNNHTVLQIRTRHSETISNGDSKVIKSPAFSIGLSRSPISIAVLGDSMAWGQGLLENEKSYSLFADALNVPTRLSVFAHSGAVTGYLDLPDGSEPPFDAISQEEWDGLERTGISHAVAQLGQRRRTRASTQAADFCMKHRDVYGEVPRALPNTMCQVAQSAFMACQMSNEGTPEVILNCTSNEPMHGRVEGFVRSPIRDIITPETGLLQSSGRLLDIRVRYDYALISTCHNGMDVPIGTASSHDIDRLKNKIEKNCDLQRGLSELPAFFPNAAVVLTGYHQYISNQTFSNFCNAQGILPEEDIKVLAGLGTGISTLSVVREELGNNVFDPNWFDNLRLEVAETIGLASNGDVPFVIRVRAFRNAENVQRQLNASDMTETRDRRKKGRGSIHQVKHTWQDSEAGFGTNAKTFGWACEISPDQSILENVENFTQSIRHEDVAVGPKRWDACTQFSLAEGLAATSLEEVSCRLASGFHPNQDGAVQISQNIMAKIRDEELLPFHGLMLPD